MEARLEYQPEEIGLLEILKFAPRSDPFSVADGQVVQQLGNPPACSAFAVDLETVTLRYGIGPDLCTGAIAPDRLQDTPPAGMDLDSEALDDAIAQAALTAIRERVSTRLFDGSLAADDLAAMVPGIAIVSSGDDSASPIEISADVVIGAPGGGAGAVGLAARSASGTCYWVATEVSTATVTRYGDGEPCTADAAAAGAQADSW